MSTKIDKSQNPHPQNRVEIKRYSSGEIESKTPYVEDEKHGAETWWYAGGTKERGMIWRDGNLHGSERWWYERGDKAGEDMWRDGKEHGVKTGWSESGSKYWEQTWRGGNLHGVETVWYENGMKAKEIYYITITEYARIEWNKEGSVIIAKFSSIHPNEDKPKH